MTNAINLAAIGSNGSAAMPNWTTGTRPASPRTGQQGFNTTLNTMEFYNGSAWATGGGLITQAVQTASFTAVAGNLYPCNTTSAAFTVTLPASPIAGNQVAIIDYAGTFATNNVILNRNSLKITGVASNFALAANRESIILTYIDSTQGWIVSTSAYTITPLYAVTYSGSYLIVAGGGGGSSNAGGSGGGGGGGGSAVEASYSFSTGTTYTVTVGAGGNGDINGIASSISVIGETASAGLGVVAQTGGASSKKISGTTTSYTGGTGGGSGGGSPGADQRIGGGGAGSGANGTNASVGSAAGVGGAGYSSSITGTAANYSGGGGGGAGGAYGAGGAGGAGGGGGGGYGSAVPGGTAGTANTGGGGGGGGGATNIISGYGGSGGSGVVILSVPTASYSSTTTGSPTVTTSGSNTIIKFTASGSYTA